VTAYVVLMILSLSIDLSQSLSSIDIAPSKTLKYYKLTDWPELVSLHQSYLHEPPTISAQHAAFTRNVKRCLITSQNVSPANAARLITTSEENFRSADILGSHDTSDSTTVPVCRIFDRFRNMPFRNMPTDNVERDFVSQTVSALGKRPLSTTPFSHAYAVRGVLPAPSELYVHTTSRIFDCFRNADVNYFPSNIVVHIDMMQDAVTHELFGSRPGL
ncbi:hypothetical protein Tco_1008645, partial [Tanacetum coccineum]